MKPPPDPNIKLTAVRAAGGLTARYAGALRIIRWLLTVPAAISGWTIGHWVPVAWAAAAGAMTVWRIKTVLPRRSSAPPAVDVCFDNISRRTD